MIIPDRCLPLLREQRTHYADLPREYGREIASTFGTFAHLIPEGAAHILDIGAGMAGIDVPLGKVYPGAVLHLLDKQDLFPGAIVSYKINLRGRTPAPGVRIVCFHGEPRPWQVQHDWVPPQP